jgi:hypothetical protein
LVFRRILFAQFPSGARTASNDLEFRRCASNRIQFVGRFQMLERGIALRALPTVTAPRLAGFALQIDGKVVED